MNKEVIPLLIRQDISLVKVDYNEASDGSESVFNDDESVKMSYISAEGL